MRKIEWKEFTKKLKILLDFSFTDEAENGQVKTKMFQKCKMVQKNFWFNAHLEFGWWQNLFFLHQIDFILDDHNVFVWLIDESVLICKHKSESDQEIVMLSLFAKLSAYKYMERHFSFSN